ncbi:kynureninase [Roseiterribacter gracilis]|uniref:Kynureninase n=1 Tax=Roseiterribacter gracilis TaxID=2812848 RepID=A0A8S8XAT1_9PROT|nr:kynureninase [Rhodospirillales bacterium TMPK1]
MSTITTRAEALALDRTDQLGTLREAFDLPTGIYLDGNSLGPLPRVTREALQHAVEIEWGNDLIRSWTKHGWIELPQQIGAQIARLIGAKPHEVVAADSTSVNLFKLGAAALRLQTGRRVILSEPGNFPTDLYILQGLTGFTPGAELRTVEPAKLEAAMDDQLALLVLTHTHYKSGQVHDMARLTAAAQKRGALVLWDLSHSAGVLDVDLNGCNADFAIGCGYKYLNGGPGAPAFLFVAERHQAKIASPLSGWMGHASPFDFTDDYAAAPGIDRFLCGTPQVLGMRALHAGLSVLEQVKPRQLQDKARRLGQIFLERVLEAGDGSLRLLSPRDPAQRGGHVSFAHEDGYAIVQALIARDIVGDFRAPDALRFGFAPTFLRYVDAWDAAEALLEIVATKSYDDARFRTRAAVT